MSDKTDTAKETQIEFVTFVVGGQNFCIEITQIREIRRWTPVTILPHSPGHVLGVMNLRGAVIPIIDLAAKLGFQEIQPTARQVIIIVAVDDRIIGLLVEAVSEILGVQSSMVKETPRTPEDDSVKAIEGIIPGESDMTKIINLQALMATGQSIAA